MAGCPLVVYFAKTGEKKEQIWIWPS